MAEAATLPVADEPNRLLRGLTQCVTFLLFLLHQLLPPAITRFFPARQQQIDSQEGALALPPAPSLPSLPPSVPGTPGGMGGPALPVAMLHEFKEIARCTTVEGIFARVRGAVLRLMPVERATVLLVDHEAHELRVILSSDANSITVPFGQGIAYAVVSSRQTIVVSDAYADPRFDRSVDDLTGYSTKSIVATPIFNHDETQVVAVLQTFSKDDAHSPEE